MNKHSSPRAHLILSVFFAACGQAGPAADDGIDTRMLAVAPAGSDAAFVDHDIPLAMAPGEKLNVRVTMRNTGVTAGANDWTNAYQLRRNPNVNNGFGIVLDPVTGSVPVGDTHDFYFVITAPTAPGNYSLGFRMYSNVAGEAGYFGEAVLVQNIAVSAATQRRWACTYVPGQSTLPAIMTPGEVRSVNVAVRNTGTATWPSTSFSLRSRDDVGPSANYNLWGASTQTTNTPLNVTVAPNAVQTFTFNITAPATPGTYSLLRQIFSQGQSTVTTPGLGFFDVLNHCVNVQIQVGAPNLLNSALISEDFPRTMAPGESRTVTVVMQNSGTETWVPNDFRLYYNLLPRTFWGQSNSPVTVNVATNQQHTFVFNITAPMTPGTYSHTYRMRKIVNPNGGQFGFLINIPVDVIAGQQQVLDAEVVAQNIPAQVSQFSNVTFEITMRNNGTANWTGSNFQLFTANVPSNLWTTQLAASLGAAETVAPGQTRVFTFQVTSPMAVGVYDSRWRMREAGGVELFGATAVTTGIIVNSCGNGVIDPGETCDDGNTNGGDGCSAVCQVEAQVIDLATDAAGRSLTGSQSSGQLANVAMGDVTASGNAAIVVGEVVNLTPAAQPARIDAGRAVGYLGGAAFLNGGTTTVPAGAAFEIWGAGSEHSLAGGGTGAIEIGDVTGDGIPDVVVSAGGAGGPGGTRAGAGGVYVIQGGAGLATAGVIDLAANPASPFLRATVHGAVAGDGAMILAVGDLSGDGVGDLVIGAPGSDLGGADSGAVYVVRGGAGLTGEIDLSAAGAALIGTVVGAAAGDQLGFVAAIGDFGNTAANDLLVGSQVAAPGGRNNAGAVWGLFNVNGTRNLAVSFDVRWFGAQASDRMGASLTVGDVTGSTRQEVVIGGIQIRNGAAVQVGAADIWLAPIAAGTYDLSLGAAPSTRIRGIEANDDAGRALGLADINGDGFLDVPVISSQADGPGNARDRSGELAFILGGNGLPALIDLAVETPAILIYGSEVLGRLGHHVQNFAAGDINGGSDDFCVGSFRAGSAGALTDPGRVDCFSSPF